MSGALGMQLEFYIVSLISSFPWLLVMLAGGVVCLRRLSTHPREGWLVGAAISLSLFAAYGLPNIIGMLIQFVPGIMTSLAPGSDTMWKFQLLYGIPVSIVQAITWGLILYAAFGEGCGPRSKYLVEDDRPGQDAD